MSHTIEQILVFISSAIFIVPLSKRLGFGSVLGYLIAGMIVGPYGLGLIQDPKSVLHFSELGVVFLLFIIGLEMHPTKLWGMKNKILSLGFFQIILCSVVFTSLLMMVFSFSVSLIIGFALSLSSTAFAIQTLNERNQFNTTFGQSSFTVLLSQDIAAIPALALIPMLSMKDSASVDLQKVTIIALSFIAIIFLSRFIIRPIFRIIASSRVQEIFTATTLLITLGVTVLMEKIGLSAALGTFIAGVLLSDSEYRHELEADIEPFKSLLMGLFFIAVGMSVSLKLIVESPILVFGVAISYLLLKFLLIQFVGRLNKLSSQNAKAMAGSIAQGGEFAFVIFGLASQFNLIESREINFFTAVVSLSMALSPLISVINEKMLSRFQKKKTPEYDKINDESPEVIIAGLGRMGQIFARALRSQKIPFVSIDHSSEQIDMLRKFGQKVYYGDASRLEILQAAGIKRAKFLIILIDDIEMSLKAVKVVQEHFPHIKIFSRARNRGEAFELMELGVEFIKRETFDSSIHFFGDLLKFMGRDQKEVSEIIERFKFHDEAMLKEQFKVRKDDKMFISVSNQAVSQLSEVLKQDEAQTYVDIKNM